MEQVKRWLVSQSRTAEQSGHFRAVCSKKQRTIRYNRLERKKNGTRSGQRDKWKERERESEKESERWKE
jgi:hypothetical protein